MQGVGQFFVAADHGGVVGFELGELAAQVVNLCGECVPVPFGLAVGGLGGRSGRSEFVQGEAEGEFDGVEVDDVALVDVAQVAQVFVQNEIGIHE